MVGRVLVVAEPVEAVGVDLVAVPVVVVLEQSPVI